MKQRADVVWGWLRKASSDAAAVESLLKGGNFDAACFHAQQAAEKYLKAFLTYHGRQFPFTHNLAELVELCAAVDPAFRLLASGLGRLTPYAVELRYDEAFAPSFEVAQEARATARAARDFVLGRLPKEVGREGY
jgi:HEPN domain-containing protein